MTRVLLVAALLAAFVSPFGGAPAAQVAGNRLIQGRIVADDSGDALPNARVSVADSGKAARITLADADGRFVIETPARATRLGVVKPGYARREVAVPPDQSPVEVRLIRAAAITGRVVDAAGDPVPNARVRAETSAAIPALVATSVTDDRGEYRLGNLAAGRLTVAVQALSAVTASERTADGIATYPTSTTLYYPGVSTRETAEPIDVKAGDEHEQVDFSLPPGYVTPPVSGGGFSFSLSSGVRSEPPTRREPLTFVRGRVVSPDGPVAGARVTLTSQVSRAAVSSQTDATGRFAFGDVAPGAFLMSASKVGYSATAPPIGQAITVGAAGAEVELKLTPWGSVSGRVLDELGEPMEGAQVQLLRVRFEGGRRQLAPADALPRQTDDRGAFRIFAVPPGQYILSASVGEVTAAELPGYARSYYPGVADPGSSPFVTLDAGQALAAADVTLVRARTARVSGTIRDAQGRPNVAGSLRLLPSRSSPMASVPIGARITDGGTFEFPNVPPGAYVIQVYGGQRSRATEGEFAALAVLVGERDLTDLILQATPGSSITGRVSFVRSTTTALPLGGAIDIEPVPVDADLAPVNGRATADIRDDWTFVMSGVSGPRRLEVTRLPAGWALQEIRVHGIDVTDSPLALGTAAQSIDDVEIVLTDRLNQVAGRVTDRGGRAVPDATVVVFPLFTDRWYARSRFLRSATTKADGSFSVEGLPPGSYYAAALATVPSGGGEAWQDPSFLESIAGPAARITLGENDRASVALTLLDPR